MKTLRLIWMAVMAAAIVTSCVKEENAPIKNDTVGKTLSIRATISDGITKVTFDPKYSGGKPTEMDLTWAVGDQIRVYDHADRSKFVDLTLDPADAGKKDGNFSSDDDLEAASYDLELLGGAGFNFASQTQPSDGVTTNLKYLASIENVTDLSHIVFTSCSSVLAITAKMPSTTVAAAIKSVDIIASEAIFNGGNTLTITFDSTGDADGDGILHFFATLPIGNTVVPSGTTLIVHFNAPGTGHTVYTRFIELGEQAFTANKLNDININASKSDLHAGLIACDGSTSAKAYLIGDKYQMLAVKDLMKADATTYFKLVDDIDMAGESWSMLNPASPYSKLIDFDGNNKTISNLGGTMFYVFKGSVRNFTLDNPTITTGAKKGAFAQFVQGTDNYITNVDVRNVITYEGSSGPCGGLIGLVNSGTSGKTTATIADCDLTDVAVNSANGQAGGIIGDVQAKVILTNCTRKGAAVANTGNFAGGLIGRATAEVSITRCSVSNGNVSGNYYVGGLIGSCNKIALAECYYKAGTVSAARFSGGLVGYKDDDASDITISNCYVTGDVVASARIAGGLLGSYQKGSSATISNSFVSGSVTVTNGFSAGGLIGWVEVAGLQMTKCLAWNTAVTATISDSNVHYSSGTVIGYAKGVKVTLTSNYRKKSFSFSDCTGNSANTLTFNSGDKSDATLSVTSSYIRPYHGKKETAETTISGFANNSGISWSSDIWDTSTATPTLKYNPEI